MTSNAQIVKDLYDKHAQQLGNYLSREVGREANDVVHEVFASALKHLNSGKRIEKPTGFLYTTARNIIIDRHRRTKAQRIIDCVEDIEQYGVDRRYCPEPKTDAQQLINIVCIEIAKLPKFLQEPFIRKRIWGHTAREIATDLEISESVIENYVSEAWQRISKNLGAIE